MVAQEMAQRAGDARAASGAMVVEGLEQHVGGSGGLRMLELVDDETVAVAARALEGNGGRRRYRHTRSRRSCWCDRQATAAFSKRSGHGKVSTHWRNGTWGRTWSTRWAAPSTMRGAPHEGQNPSRRSRDGIAGSEPNVRSRAGLVVDSIEKVLQINIYHESTVPFHIRLGFRYRLVRRATRRESMVRFRKGRIPTPLPYRLLEKNALMLPLSAGREASSSVAASAYECHRPKRTLL